MEQFLRDNASGVFAIVGALISGIVVLLGVGLQARKEVQFRLAERLLERRLVAHEAVIQFAQTMREMETLGYSGEDGEIPRFPKILSSEKQFRSWHGLFLSTMGQYSTWLAKPVRHEMNLLQDYTLTLFRDLNGASSNVYPLVGLIVRQDFIDFSSELEKLSRHFLMKELTKLRLNDLGAWHKYPIKETEHRFSKTKFAQNRERITDLVAGNSQCTDGNH